MAPLPAARHLGQRAEILERVDVNIRRFGKDVAGVAHPTVLPSCVRDTIHGPEARGAGLRIAKRLPIEERRQQLAKAILHFAWLAESAVEKRLESLLRFSPRQRGCKGVEGVEEAVDRWQRDLVNEILRCRDRAPIEGGNAAGEHGHETVQLSVRKSPIDVSVPFSGLTVKVVRPENDFERATAAEE